MYRPWGESTEQTVEETSLMVAVSQALRRSRRSDDLQVYVLGLIDGGMGYRDIAKHLQDVTGIPLSHPTIMRWEKRWREGRNGAAA